MALIEIRFLKLLFLLTVISGVNSLKILAIFGFPAISHFAVYRPLLKGLLEKGYHLTVLGYVSLNETTPLYKEVLLKNPGRNSKEVLSMEQLDGYGIRQYFGAYYGYLYGLQLCDTALSSPAYKEFLNDNGQYDIIILELFYANCISLPFVEKFKIPVIAIQSHNLMAWNYELFGSPSNPSYIPSIYLQKSDRMNFCDRLENLLSVISSSLYYYFFISAYDVHVIKKHLGISVSPYISNASVLLTNTHFSLHRSKPLVPSIIEICGIHIQKTKPLPEHIEKWINESTHGVIYFSFGSMIKGHTFPEEKRQMFIRAFSRLPQRILWKWETDTMSGKPENVMIEKWMPQFDILSHPNVKAFIAHGGLLGATEAVHCGVPLIVMPQFGDQFTNAKAIEASGGGVILDYRSLDEESIYNALKTVLDPSFNKKAKELSARFRDRPMPPLETAIYWVEYVARHGGAPHLRTAAVGMPLYQYLLLDVIAFLSTILFLFVYISFVITRAIFRRLFKSKEKVKKN